MESHNELFSPVSLPEKLVPFELKRRATMDRIRISLKTIPIISKNRTMANSRMEEEFKTTDDLDNFQSSSNMSDHLLSDGDHVCSFQQNYEILEKLGQGSSGVVHRCVQKKTDELFAVKTFSFQDEHVPGLKSNFLVLKRLQHPSILKYQGLYLDFSKHLGHLVMQYADAPSLTKAHLKSQKEIRNVIHQLLMALSYLHKQDIVHRDIKPENILYDPIEKTIKLIDFGISRRYRRRGVLFDMWTITGTLYYRAPQMFSGGYRQGVDVWATGVLLYEMICGHTPFESEYHSQTIENIRNGELAFPSEFEDYSKEVKQLISRMLIRDPEQRPSTCTCLKDIWLYSTHTHHHKKINQGSLKVIKDDTWNEFQTCDQFQICNSNELYEPLIGSLRFIDVEQDSMSVKNKAPSVRKYQPFIRKMSQDRFYFDTDFEELNSASSIGSMRIKNMRNSGFF